jgi:NAD(P)-dependent dehydrogenase (short-subunit alcohol dehydrogenase family)
MLLLGEAPILSAALHATLTASAYRVRHVLPGKQTRALSHDRFEVDWSSLDAVQALYGLLTQSGETVGAVLNLMGFTEPALSTQDSHLDDAKRLFLLLKVLEKDLKESARSGGGWLINFTMLDGQFGLRKADAFPLGTAGTLGVAKSVAREWSHVRVKCIDLDRQSDPYIIAAQVMEELRTADPLVEVGFTAAGRWTVALQEDSASPAELSRLALGPDAVLLVTGGAYGITAEITKALAEQYRPHLVLVGRSPLPPPEAPETRHLQDPHALRQFLIQELRAMHSQVTPADIERRLERLQKDRQIRATLAAIEQAGASIEYHALDVRNAEAFGTLVETIYAERGRIDGVLHGAGILENKLIRDKTPESFTAVFDTKVIPATILAHTLRLDTLKFVVFFSSIAGRFGSIGQCDYNAANEVVNKLADRLNHAWPHVHVVSINWGPWDGGMVGDELRNLYVTKDIHVIPTDIGVRFCLEELQRGKSKTPEVVISPSVKQISAWKLGKF